MLRAISQQASKVRATQAIATALALISVVAVLSVIGSPVAEAHETRRIHSYYFDVGFKNEPAYEGMLNGVALVVTRAVASDTDSDDDHAHEDDDHDHEHGEGMTDDDSDSMMSSRDVTSHGVHFHSPAFSRNNTFEFTIAEGLSDLTIPYHIHPGEFEGDIEINNEQGTGDTFNVEITDDGLSPVILTASVGDTVVWTNNTSFNASVMSGPHSSMSDEIMSEMMGMEATTIIHGEGVTGLSSTLQVEVTHEPTGSVFTLALNETSANPGYYEAPFIPTAPGEYTFRFFGEVEGLIVDDAFTSGPDTFDTVVPADAIQFPNPIQSAREIENAVSGARDSASNAIDRASTAIDEAERGSNSANIALGLAIVAILAGLAGAVLGGYAFLSTRSARE